MLHDRLNYWYLTSSGAHYSTINNVFLVFDLLFGLGLLGFNFGWWESFYIFWSVRWGLFTFWCVGWRLVADWLLIFCCPKIQVGGWECENEEMKIQVGGWECGNDPLIYRTTFEGRRRILWVNLFCCTPTVSASPSNLFSPQSQFSLSQWYPLTNALQLWFEHETKQFQLFPPYPHALTQIHSLESKSALLSYFHLKGLSAGYIYHTYQHTSKEIIYNHPDPQTTSIPSYRNFLAKSTLQVV